MVRIWLGLIALVVVLTVFSFIDALLISPLRVRGLPKWAWLLVIALIPLFGSLLWLFVGRARAGHTVAPDDDPEFLAELKKLLDDEGGPRG